MKPSYVWLLCLSMLGCAGRMISSDGGGGTDSGPPGVDSGPRVDAGGGRDAGPPRDAGTDAGFDACACPAYPTVCSAPAVDVPAFTPDATDVATQLFDVIACAGSTLDLAIYQAEWDCIGGALQAALAADPDLTLRVVVDDRECPTASCFVDALTPAGRVTVVRDARTALMHHKFAIADGTRLWVNSGNFTRRSFCTDLNNSIVIEEPAIVARYQTVFDRMYTLMEFGPVAAEGGTTSGIYTVYFSPETPTSMAPEWLNAMVAAIGTATTSVDLMIFAWTRTEISDALIAAHMRGVTVRALVAPSYANDVPAQALLAAGADVRVASVHSKVMIIDGTTVITGSANWSENAWSNNENSLWIADGAVGTAFIAEFDAHYAGAPAAMPVP